MFQPFRKIVVGIDYSEPSLAALRQAIHLTNASGGEVVAVEVIEREVLDEQVRFHRIAAEQAVDRIHSHLLGFLARHGLGGDCEAHVMIGSPLRCLEEVCTASEADLLVLGARGWDHESGSVGAVASKCIRRSSLPVMLVRGSQSAPFRRITACTDFSETSLLALDRAIHLARISKGSLDVIHVNRPVWIQPAHIQYDLSSLPDKDYQEQYRGLVQERLREHVSGRGLPEFEGMRLHVLESMRPADAIRTFVGENEVDLVVVGTERGGGWGTRLLGTTAERVIRQAGASVLAVKPAKPIP